MLLSFVCKSTRKNISLLHDHLLLQAFALWDGIDLGLEWSGIVNITDCPTV